MIAIQVERIHERRRAVRVEDGGRAYVTERCAREEPLPELDEALAPLFGRVANLSETGLLLELDEAVAPGRPVEIGVELEGRVLLIEGVVARLLRARGSTRVHVGVRFGLLPEAARAAIRRRVCARQGRPQLN